MLQALRINKVPLIDQVAKIRSTLSGHPLSMVPESVKKATEAFQTLRTRYGDEERVLALRLKELKKSGQRPQGPMEQVAWYTDLISKMQRLLELGSHNDDLARVAFGGDVFRTILNLFPDKEVAKMGQASQEQHGKYTKARLESLVKCLEKKRGDANYVDKMVDKKEKPPSGGGESGAGGLGNRGHTVQQTAGLGDNLECRVCHALLCRRQKPNYPAFKNHLGTKYSGCPNFVSSTQQNRDYACYIANICKICLDPKVNNSADHLTKCSVAKEIKAGRKTERSCQVKDCNLSIWTCRDHKDDPANAVAIEMRKQSVVQQGWTMGMVTIMGTAMASATSSPTSKKKKKVKLQRKAKSPANSKSAEETVLKDISDDPLVEKTKETPPVLPPSSSTASSPTSGRKEKSSKAPESPASLKAALEDNPDDLGVGEQAVENMVARIRAKGVNVVEEPVGRPMFQFFLANGRTKAVKTFVDSDALMQSSEKVFLQSNGMVQSANLAPATWEGLVVWVSVPVTSGSAMCRWSLGNTPRSGDTL